MSYTRTAKAAFDSAAWKAIEIYFPKMFPWKIPETLDKTTPLSPNPPSPLGLQNLPNANLLPNLLPTLCCYLAILKKKKKRKMIVSSACAKAGLGFISKKMEISLPPSPPTPLKRTTVLWRGLHNIKGRLAIGRCHQTAPSLFSQDAD